MRNINYPFDNSLSLDTTLYTNVLSFILNSNDPNIELKWVPHDNIWYILLIALKDIQIGE